MGAGVRGLMDERFYGQRRSPSSGRFENVRSPGRRKPTFQESVQISRSCRLVFRGRGLNRVLPSFQVARCPRKLSQPLMPALRLR